MRVSTSSPATAVSLLLVLVMSGCWSHRVQTMSPVTSAGQDSLRYTSWAFFWRSNVTQPSPECVSGGLKDVVVHSNWGFSLVRAATLGAVAPVEFERRCATPIIDPPAADTVTSDGGTHVSLLWDTADRDPTVQCGDRPMARVAVKPNPLFDLLSAGTLGLVSPARVRAYCVTGAPAEPGQ